MNRTFDPNSGDDVAPSRINQRFGLTLDVPAVLQEATVSVEAFLMLELSLDSNLYIAANFSSIMNNPNDVGGAISVSQLAAFVYC